MTPVAIPVAVSATSWDAALAETLSGAAERAFADGTHGTVHSVHHRVVNVLFCDALVAIADDGIDDAPATIRVPLSGWDARGIRQGAPVVGGRDRIELPGTDRMLVVSLSGAPPWDAPRTDLSELTSGDLARALALLDALPSPAPVTPFGRAAAELLRSRIRMLRAALRTGDDEGTRTAASALIGLGEGLTPSGDDVLTGLGLLAAQDGMLLSSSLPALTDAIRGGGVRTGLLSATTMAHAVAGRGRQSLHDLIAAIRDRDGDALRRAADRILQIGHTSGADILSGIRLALDVERAARRGGPACLRDDNKKKKKEQS
ncbi:MULTISPECIES: DUF2877 domain-containing protein [unclassified Microbacterium]|uniref:DUF2877 domain-containing protein n=1 Tax=unclassified Microbacterium TaxID=2609290 RepID=UPI0012F98072|nr:DUF2877 domain-containing protein [Microbacterium sp. MAH-37]MVQ41782.1 DUF2877 domain-containing protein [Microbacterium sp. MAH-37]